jgi:hypothetical protein
LGIQRYEGLIAFGKCRFIAEIIDETERMDDRKSLIPLSPLQQWLGNMNAIVLSLRRGDIRTLKAQFQSLSQSLSSIFSLSLIEGSSKWPTRFNEVRVS